jgi:hypothetical protein
MNNIYECDIKLLEKHFYTHMNTELRVGMLVIGRYIYTVFRYVEKHEILEKKVPYIEYQNTKIYI